MANYIYMTEDNKHAAMGAHGKTKVYFKVGYSKHPVMRGGQMKQAARRTLGFEINTMRVAIYTAPLSSDDKNLALFVESFVLNKVMHMPSTVILKKGKEFMRISIADRARCYKALPNWVAEAEAQYIRGEA